MIRPAIFVYLIMELIGIISSVVAAIVALATLWFSVRTSKGSILKRIDKKEAQMRIIDDMMLRQNGLYGRFPRVITPLDEKRDKLQSEIDALKRKL